jgi:hypothetical protein
MQHATERSKQSTITCMKLRTCDLAFQHPQLVAQHTDLDLLCLLGAHPQHKQLQQPAQHPVQKRQHHAPRTTHLDDRADRLSYPPPTATNLDLTSGDRVSGTHTSG